MDGVAVFALLPRSRRRAGQTTSNSDAQEHDGLAWSHVGALRYRRSGGSARIFHSAAALCAALSRGCCSRAFGNGLVWRRDHGVLRFWNHTAAARFAVATFPSGRTTFSAVDGLCTPGLGLGQRRAAFRAWNLHRIHWMPHVPLKTLVPEQRQLECRHCHTRFRATEREREFCCSGCRFVFHLLHKRGLEDFYRYGETMAPAGNFVFHDRDYKWLEELQKAAEAGPTETAEITLEVQGISCAGCVWLLEAVFMEYPGAVECAVNSSAGTLRLRWRSGACELTAYAQDVQRFGYLIGPVEGKSKSVLPGLTRKLGLCGFLALNAMLFALPRYLGIEPSDALQALFDVISFVIATASVAVGGTYFFRRALTALRFGSLHIDLPISLGLAFAYAGSVVAWFNDQHALNYFDFVSIFTFLMLLGRWLQERAVEANRQRLLGLKLSPGRLRILKDGSESQEASKVRAGDKYFVGRNQLVPVRSRLLKGGGTFALNWITGEPAPRSFASGGIVPSGARSLVEDDLLCEALEDWSSSQLSSLMRIDAEREWRNRGLEKLIKVYLVIVLVLAVAGLFFWGLGGGGWASAFQVLISVLVVSCPCAVGVALPLLDDIAAARMQHHGVYLRDGSLWVRLQRVTTLLFDKTGTITLETLRPANPDVFDGLSAQTKSYLLRLVERSLHPVAACLRESLLSEGIEAAEGAVEVVEIPGMGLSWDSQIGCWSLGRASWIKRGDTTSGTVLALDGTELARFHFREELRPDADRQVMQFLTAGKQVYLLSGDAPERVQVLGASLGLPVDHALGGLTPEEKEALVKDRWSGNSLMLGDGANDSLAFDAALCRGTPAVDTGLLEHKADFYLLGRGLNGLGVLFAAATRHALATRTVFGFALTYNAVAVSAALGGWMSPLVAAIIMPLSSLASIGIVLSIFRVSAPRNESHHNTSYAHE